MRNWDLGNVKITNQLYQTNESVSLLIGQLLTHQNRQLHPDNLHQSEFKVFSQFADDGIIQFLVQELPDMTHEFIEFGVGNYHESNTRFLLMQNNWRGLIFDSSSKNIAYIKSQDYYWRYDITAAEAFITKKNINNLINKNNFSGNIGLLHIDVDGNDYWIWQAIECVKPAIAIIEYNSVFGSKRAITIPYKKTFNRTEAHYSNLYFGASLPALIHLAKAKGYVFIGCNSAGNNAFFVQKKYAQRSAIKKLIKSARFVESKFRESRDQSGKLTYLSGKDRTRLIAGLPVVNVKTNRKEQL